MSPPSSLSDQKWITDLDSIADDRCDLSALLRDQWRHRIVPRDDVTSRATARRTLAVGGPVYAAMHSTRMGTPALAALALAATHTALQAFGHGTKTVVAFVDATKASAAGVGLPGIPTVIDHAADSTLTCSIALAYIESALAANVTDQRRPEATFGRGLFDTALVLADRALADAELPPTPLVVVVHDDASAECVVCTIVYAAELFEDAVVDGILSVIQQVFGQYVCRPHCHVGQVELISEAHRRQLAEWNDTAGDFAEDKRLNELFEMCAAQVPDRKAVVFRDRCITYRELDARANQLAHWLISPAVGVAPRDVVGLYLDKSDLGVIATFAIWKAGAAYVPIDTTYPPGRIRSTLSETRPTAIVTNRRHSHRLQEILRTDGHSAEIIDIESVLGPDGPATAMPPEKPSLHLTSEDLAYITYTSGTTGVPKGVPKEHRSVVNSITDLTQRYHMEHPDRERVALFASYVFEPHLRQTLIALINGHTLVVVPDDVRLDPDLFPEYLARHRVTYLNATGSVLLHFDLGRCPDLRKLLLVGEELTSAGLRQLRERFGGEIINEYAFTESAFVTAIKRFAPTVAQRTDRSIGEPLRNVTWYVLSQTRKQLPIGAIGELYIGGCGIARGYLNQDDLTRKAFFPNPFQSDNDRSRDYNGRIYRTGDLARMLPNGEVEFLGRADFQLKINGIRVEPGEIEARASDHPGVRKCVVVPIDNAAHPGDKCLVGYYVTEPGTDLAEADLLAFLEQRLIQVMVPARMIRLDRIPVTVNGKVDRQALPQAGAAHLASADHSAQDTAVRRALRNIWARVLGLPAACINDSDDFFRLGGHSISCILLIARVRHSLRRNLNVEEVFRLRTLANMASHLEHAEYIAPTQTSHNLPAGQLLANGLQQGLLYHALKSDDDDDAYVVQSVFRYHTRIRPDVMKSSWQAARRRFPSLRLRFPPTADPVQCIDSEQGQIDWRYTDLSECALADQEEYIERLRAADLVERYRPSEGRLFRVYLVKQRADRFTMMFSCHHLIIDGWSLAVLHDHIHRHYLALIEGRTVEPGEDRAFIAAQRYWQDHRQDHTDYWTTVIDAIKERGDYNGLLNSASRYRVALRGYDRVRDRKSMQLRVNAELRSALAQACQTNGATLHSVLQFAWHTALHAMGGGSSTVVGTIVSGRDIPVDGIEHSVGLFINTLPLVVDHTGDRSRSVLAAVADIQSAVNAMNARSVVDLGRLASGTLKRDLFDTLFVLENYPQLLDDAEEQRHRDVLRFERSFDADRVDHPMAVVAREDGDDLTVTVWYAGEILDDTAVKTLLDVFEHVLLQVADGMSQPVSDLHVSSRSMLAQLDTFNDTDADFPAEKTLSELFEEVAAVWPDKVAVVYNDTRLTYRELNEYANRLAHGLRALTPLRADDFVALAMNNSELMIVAILAVWKAGVAYVPIDPEYPDERIAFMLGDTNARLILTVRTHAERLSRLQPETIPEPVAIDDCDLSDRCSENLPSTARSTDLAYGIYTSGTTGRPKAVLVEHRGVANLNTSLSALFGLNARDGAEAVLSFSNYVFDHFVEVLTDALLTGQTLVVMDGRMRTDGKRLCRYMNDNNVTYLSGTPSVLSLYDFSAAHTLRRIDAIGEDFTEAVFAKIRRTFPRGVIVNGYGPTEISITSHKRLYASDEPRRDKSIGFPVANTSCYVLNSSMQRLPVGGVGELYIGGAGVARGYLNRPDLTADRFIDNPFQTAEDKRRSRKSRLYKTGDLARWLPNGEIEYLGRVDLQVKIRGQRVELGEIESVLSCYPGVERALVVAGQHRAAVAAPQKYLVGYYIAEFDLDEKVIMRWMRRKLPSALVPMRIMRISDIPVTASGKLDPSRLPEVQFASRATDHIVVPSTPIEIRLCALWAHALGIAPHAIGIHDDFFALGGDSLRIMALTQGVTSTFGCDVGVANIMRDTTIAAQAALVQRSLRAQAVATDEPVIGDLNPPVSLAQERLLFIDQFEGGTWAFNIPFTLRVAGRSPAAIAAALRVLLARHAALRTLLRADGDGRHRQHILDEPDADAAFCIETLTVGSCDELDEALATRARHIFGVSQELPVRACLISLDATPDVSYLGLVFHHTCFDGWSWDIYQRELAIILGTAAERLPTVVSTYVDFVGWQRQYLNEGRRSELGDYWRRALEGTEPIRLPLDRPRPPRFDYRGREVLFHLDEEVVDDLDALAQATRVSLYSVLLAAWCLMLRVYTGQTDLVVATPSANRGRPEFAGVIGLIANLVAIRVSVDQALSVTEYVQRVGAAVVEAAAHAELPFERLVAELNAETDPSRHPVAQVNFTMLPWTESADQSVGPLSAYAPAATEETSVKFDLSTMLHRTPDGLAGVVTYAASLFEDATAHGFIETFKLIAAQFARSCQTGDEIHLRELAWTLDRDDDRCRSVAEGDVDAPLPTLCALFESAVQQRPDAVALVCRDTRLTFAELNARANRLARRLRATTEFGPHDVIALVLDRSELTVIAILATWKAGAGYLPIDPTYPDDRIAFMLRDTAARLVLTNTSSAARLYRIAPDASSVLELEPLELGEYPPDNVELPIADRNLAYAIYTSGTTGAPKAVLVTHRNVASFHASLRARCIGPDAHSHGSTLFLSNFVFDFSIEQLVLSVLSGNTLIIPPSTSAPDFYATLQRERLTYLSGTPTQVVQLDLARLTDLRTILVAGEPFLPHQLAQIRCHYSGPILHAYGTTETTVYNTVRRFEPEDAYRNDLGAALANSRLHILDDTLRPLPAGAIGELHIAGDCVSDGYLNRPRLTAERFVDRQIPDNAADRAVLYKTGDLVRRGVDGALQFLGRNDAQVKIRGVRIEPGEVESAIMACPGVRECAVVARTEQGLPEQRRLVAYYVAQAGATVDDDQIYAALRTTLAPNAIPASLVRMHHPLPTTVNGKLDNDALPRVPMSSARSLYAPPRDRQEAKVCRLWAEALAIPVVGIDDHFFRCGGDSIGALRLVSRLRRDTGLSVTVKDIFDFPSVRELYDLARVRPQSGSQASGAQQREAGVQPPRGDCPLLPVQRWFFAKPLTARARWNHTFAIRTPPLDTVRLYGALEALVDHHDAFWLRYRQRDNGPEQFYSASRPHVALHTLDVQTLSEAQLHRQLSLWQDDFDLEHGPTCCAAYLFGYPDGSARIWLALHHLMVDVVSWHVIAQDLEITYHGGTLGDPLDTFGQWVRAVPKYVPSDAESQIWDEIARDVASELRDRFPAVPAQTASRCERSWLTAAETRDLLTQSGWAYDTEISDLLLTAVGYALRSLTGHTRNHVTIEGHGREQFDGAPDVGDAVGWFTTMHPMPIEVGPDLGRSLLQTRHNRRRIPHHGVGYGAQRGTYGGLSAPLAPVGFNYLGRFDSEDMPNDRPAAWRIDPTELVTGAILHGENASDSVLDITMSCIDGRLTTVVASKLGEVATQHFAADLQAALRELIAHTTAVVRTGVRESARHTSAGTDDFDPYLIVNDDAPGPILFMLPPGEGGAECYLGNLARTLPRNRLVLFNNRHLHTPSESFEALADYYVTQIRRIQPTGPYNLLGWSFGGVLAVEIASQLARAHGLIESLVLIDPYFNVAKAVADLGLAAAEPLLDPINYRYQPRGGDLNRLSESVRRMVLFKAGMRNDTVRNEHQRSLFDYFHDSHCNNLETLLPGFPVQVEVLRDATHHSWVYDHSLVTAMGQLVTELMAATAS